MSDVDFSKPLVCSDPDLEIIKIFPVHYKNADLTHAIHLRLKETGQETVVAIGPTAKCNTTYVFHRYVDILNAPPKIVYETWQNLYKDGFIGGVCASKSSSDDAAMISKPRDSILYSVYYDNGDVKREIIPV